MASIFRKDDQHVDKPNRNVFPKTFESNLTTKFGQILPVFCRPVMNGETIKIDPKMNFNFLPMVFPIQNRVRASLSFYYVRNRNLWKEWEDFQFKMKDGLVPPYHVFREETYRDMLRVGGVLDGLGVKVVLRGNYKVKLAIPQRSKRYSAIDHYFYDAWTQSFERGDDYPALLMSAFANQPFAEFDQAYTKTNTVSASRDLRLYRKPIQLEDGIIHLVFADGQSSVAEDIYLLAHRWVSAEKTVDISESTTESEERTSGNRDTASSRQNGKSNSSRDSRSVEVNRDVSTSVRKQVTSDRVLEPIIIKVPVNGTFPRRDVSINGIELATLDGVFVRYDDSFTPKFGVEIMTYPTFGASGVPLSELTLDSLPFPYVNHRGEVVDGDGRLHIVSMPARGVKSIYNAFIRNEANNPFMINGVPEYNKYIDNETGGPDSDYYNMYYRNWQDDCFTTALHSPQHGEAPLVGLVNQSNTTENSVYVTFANDDGTKNRVKFITNGLPNSYNSQIVQLAPAYYDENNNLVPDTPSDGYVGQLQEAMMEAVKFGITINDFRNVNSFQRWLENNVRKGYKYRDQIKAHYGVSVRYDTLDMPEYLGGMSRDMNVIQVTQTTENQYGNLGDYSGQAWIEGEMQHEINHYCDEEGYIIGLLSIQPIAPYSDAMPKHLLRENAFDYFSPEFGKIGMQPILNREIAPLQSFYEKNGDKVFGYQRAWYDSLDGLSEVHGKFQTDFRNFLITRTFDSVPELGEDFLVMSDDDINNIFYVNDDEDKILGQILFNYDSIIPVPLYGISALE